MPEVPKRLWRRLPNISSMFLDEGTELTSAFVTDPLCCPARASLLTGLYTHNHGVFTNDAQLFYPTETIATALQRSGYYTAIAGKYLNLTENLDNKFPPGWSKASIFGGSYYQYDLFRNGIKERHGNNASDYSTDVFAKDSIQFLKYAPPSQPVFLYMNPYAVHEGRDADGAYAAFIPVPAARHKGDSRCANLAPLKTPAYNETDVSDKPEYIKALSPVRFSTGWPLTKTCESLLAVDEWLGKVKKELKDQRRYRNTVFILTADNGMAWGDHRWPKKVAPYSISVPFFVRWEAKMGIVPRKISIPILNIDIAPTLCTIAGCTLGPYPTGQLVPDGRSMYDAILTGIDNAPRQEFYSESLTGDSLISPWVSPRWSAIITTSYSPLGRWHYIEYETGEKELYNLTNSPCSNWTPSKTGDPCGLNNLLGSKAKPTQQTLDLANILSQKLAGFKANAIPAYAPPSGKIPTED